MARWTDPAVVRDCRVGRDGLADLLSHASRSERDRACSNRNCQNPCTSSLHPALVVEDRCASCNHADRMVRELHGGTHERRATNLFSSKTRVHGGRAVDHRNFGARAGGVVGSVIKATGVAQFSALAPRSRKNRSARSTSRSSDHATGFDSDVRISRRQFARSGAKFQRPIETRRWCRDRRRQAA